MNNKTCNGKIRTTSECFHSGIQGLLHIMMLAASFFLIAIISIDTFKDVSLLTQSTFYKMQFWVCMLFLLDFFVELALADKKWHYVKTHWLFLIVSIPYLSIIGWFSADVSHEVVYFLRFMPLVRGGYALAIVIGWLSSNRVSSLFTTYLVILISIIYFSSLIFFVREQGINQTVNNYGDALWWAFMDATTVGSNVYAVTFTGKVLSILLAALGMMMFPIFTVYVTNLVEQANQKKGENTREE